MPNCYNIQWPYGSCCTVLCMDPSKRVTTKGIASFTFFSVRTTEHIVLQSIPSQPNRYPAERLLVQEGAGGTSVAKEWSGLRKILVPAPPIVQRSQAMRTHVPHASPPEQSSSAPAAAASTPPPTVAPAPARDNNKNNSGGGQGARQSGGDARASDTTVNREVRSGNSDSGDSASQTTPGSSLRSSAIDGDADESSERLAFITQCLQVWHCFAVLHCTVQCLIHPHPKGK